MIGISEARPPYVTFYQTAMPDKEATLREGRHMTKNVNMVQVMQPGCKDVYENHAEKWLASIKEAMLQGSASAYPAEWVDGFHRKYQMWLDGVENKVPEGETPLKEVPWVTPAEVANMAGIHVYTLEGAAGMTEDALRSAGMGSRAFRDKARAYLESAKDHGKVAEQVAALMAQVDLKDGIIAKLTERIEALEADKPKRGRPRVELQEAA